MGSKKEKVRHITCTGTNCDGKVKVIGVPGKMVKVRCPKCKKSEGELETTKRKNSADKVPKTHPRAKQEDGSESFIKSTLVFLDDDEKDE